MTDRLQTILQNANIPSPPAVAVRLLDLVAKADVDIEELSKTISADPKLSSRLIDYCNSPMLGISREVSSLRQAIMVLGTRTLRLLSLSFSLMETKGEEGFDYDSFWQKSLAMGLAAKHLAEPLGQDCDEEFLQGLVFNIGIVGIASTVKSEYRREDFLGKSTLECVEIEAEKFGVHRFEVGAALLEKWNFPAMMVETMRSFDGKSENSKSKTLAESIAELVVNSEVSPAQIDITRNLANELLGRDKFETLVDAILAEWQQYSTLFDYDSVPADSLMQLELQAKESMMNISLGLDSEINTIAAQKELLERTAMTDTLTNLKNRTAYSAEYEGFVDFHRRQRRGMGLMVIDIDNFKLVNDTYGHAVGDEILKGVSECLQKNCRKYDSVYRFGGEEFVVLIQDCDDSSISLVAERFRSAIANLVVETAKGAHSVTVSIGVCWGRDGVVPSHEEIFEVADENLYKAKRAGRNQCVIYEFNAATAS